MPKFTTVAELRTFLQDPPQKLIDYLAKDPAPTQDWRIFGSSVLALLEHQESMIIAQAQQLSEAIKAIRVLATRGGVSAGGGSSGGSVDVGDMNPIQDATPFPGHVTPGGNGGGVSGPLPEEPPAAAAPAAAPKAKSGKNGSKDVQA